MYNKHKSIARSMNDNSRLEIETLTKDTYAQTGTRMRLHHMSAKAPLNTSQTTNSLVKGGLFTLEGRNTAGAGVAPRSSTSSTSATASLLFDEHLFKPMG
jgi:hypothetical protein